MSYTDWKIHLIHGIPKQKKKFIYYVDPVSGIKGGGFRIVSSQERK